MRRSPNALTLLGWSGRHTEAPLRLFGPVAPPDFDIGSSVPEVKLPPQPPRELRVDMRELVYSLPIGCDRKSNEAFSNEIGSKLTEGELEKQMPRFSFQSNTFVKNG